jgi:hypothetical protein
MPTEQHINPLSDIEIARQAKMRPIQEIDSGDCGQARD